MAGDDWKFHYGSAVLAGVLVGLMFVNWWPQ